MIFSIDCIRRQCFGLETASGQPYLIDILHKPQHIPVFSAYAKNRTQRRGNFKMGDRTVRLDILVDLDGGDIGTFAERRNRRVVMMKSDLSCIFRYAVFQTPRIKPVPAVFDRYIVSAVAYVRRPYRRRFYDFRYCPRKVPIGCAGTFGTFDILFGIKEIRTVFPYFRRRIEPLFKRFYK